MSATPKQFNPPDDAALIRSTDLLGDETCQTCKFWARIFSRAEDDDDWDWEEATRAAHMRDLHKFVGVSSNNIYWNLTQAPIRQILIPTNERKYISVINPEILKLEGQENNYVEACGSVPNKVYIVRRKPYVLISGYTIEKERIELEYGSKDFYAGDDPIYSSYSNPEWVIQHEMDHLDGITIQDKGAALV